MTTTDVCDWCIVEIDSDNGVDDPRASEWVVAGRPLCTSHAIREMTEILESPASFVHSWPTGEDRVAWGDAVPFYIEVRMIE